MTNRLLSLLLCLLMVFGGAEAAQKKKKTAYKKLTKTYVNTPLTDALQDIGHRTGYIINFEDADLDIGQVVNKKFKEVSAVSAVKKILGKQYVVKSKKGVIRITNLPVPPTVYQSVAAEPYKVEEDDEKIVKTYADTVWSVSCRTQTHLIESDSIILPAPTRKGHYVQAMLGLGYGSMGYTLKDASGTKVGKNMGDLQGGLQVQYAYYFYENWGITAGLGFSAFGSYGVLDNRNEWSEYKGMKIGDSDGESYTHYALTHKWREQQITHIVELPVGVQCQYPLNDSDVRLYAGAGVRVGVPVYSKWELKSGALEHQGYYPQWDMLVTDLDDRDFYTETIGDDFSKDRHNLNLKKVALSVGVDLGVMIPLNKQLDLLCGVYGQVNCLDLNNESRQPVGWQQAEQNGYRQHAFMNEYKGELASDFASAVRPWGVGLKVGISWHHVEKPRKPEPKYERIQLCDTTFSVTERQETILKPKQEAARQIVRLMNKSVIWFDVNSIEPKLEPADILDRIAAVLVENPEQKIIVSGHASKEGNARKNRILSEQRAQAVADLLIAKGAKPEQISVEAHAADIAYDAGNGTEHSIALDRRTEIIPVE
ncbi:MAG: OmpA family protein [Paludibacter sp.]|nr:OmpA family protein [Bacteroidales bacterium]MCM1069187.1 OmpA family protein [Prevotella sp.]MCM1354092.1 OmpA family protein [Bacteroides sp.]MCM1442935.1 OmpA family protein [Muribaculum sp.]MCM1481742.1 OmpA family protein [Paludibacter sp.]